MQPKFSSVLAILAALLVLSSGPLAFVAAGSQQDEKQPTHYIVKADRIFAPFDASADAEGWVGDCWLEVQDGRVKRLGRGDLPTGVEVQDLGSVWLMPGLVDMGAEIFVGGDPDGIGPRYVAADKFNPFADFKAVWNHGVTSARLGAPGRRFIAGQGSVVKFGGSPETAVVLQRSVDLLVNFNDEKGRSEPDYDNVPFPSSADVPYEPRPEPKPQTRLGRIDALKTELAAARSKGAKDARTAALADFLATGRPLRIDARRAADIVQALTALGEIAAYSVPAYIAGGDEALAVVDSLAKAGVPVVFEMDNVVTRLDDSGWNEIRPWRRDPSAPAALEKMGVTVALGGAGSDLLMAASMAVGAGLSPRSALEAITSRPARLLGLADRIGSLEAGRDADFIVLNGHPLSSLSHVQDVFVGGAKAWHRRGDERPLVVRAGRIMDGTGAVWIDGEVLIEKGKIVACGQRVPHPMNARIVDAGADAVVTPGFIDVHSFLGLENDRAAPATELPIADVIGSASADFADVARAGVTTVVVAPQRVSNTGAQAVALKTVGRNHADLVAKPMAAVKIAVGGSSDQVRSSLTGLLSKAKKYQETWVKYEEDLAKFKSGAPVAPESKPAPETAPAKAPEAKEEAKKGDDDADAGDALSGTWAVTLSGGPMPKPQEGLTAKIRLEGDRVAGTITNPLDTDEDATFQGTFDGKTLRADLDVETPFGATTLVAQLTKADNLKGTISLGGVMDIDLNAVRTKKGAPKITVPVAVVATTAEAAPGAPKKPKLDDKLEPMRAVFDGKAGVIVQVKGGPLIRTVSQVFADYKLPVVVLDGAGITDVLDEIKGEFALALPQNLVDDADSDRGFLPAMLERQGLAMAFQSSAGWGGNGLPLLARMAVRQGMGPEAALTALTSGAAKFLRLDDTVGALKAGLDGDVLIFDGDPFDARTRLLKVFIRGQEVK